MKNVLCAVGIFASLFLFVGQTVAGENGKEKKSIVFLNKVKNYWLNSGAIQSAEQKYQEAKLVYEQVYFERVVCAKDAASEKKVGIMVPKHITDDISQAICKVLGIIGGFDSNSFDKQLEEAYKIIRTAENAAAYDLFRECFNKYAKAVIAEADQKVTKDNESDSAVCKYISGKGSFEENLKNAKAGLESAASDLSAAKHWIYVNAMHATKYPFTSWRKWVAIPAVTCVVALGGYVAYALLTKKSLPGIKPMADVVNTFLQKRHTHYFVSRVPVVSSVL